MAQPEMETADNVAIRAAWVIFRCIMGEHNASGAGSIRLWWAPAKVGRRFAESDVGWIRSVP